MCDSPILAWRDERGEINLYCKLSDYVPDVYSRQHDRRWLLLPCGKCFSCRISLARMWSMRCAYELKSHPANTMVTLTYNDDNLPEGGNLCKYDYQCFFKRLRKHFDDECKRMRALTGDNSLSPLRIRYYGCGEYGDKYGRPHYHFIIFGWCPPDKVLFYVKDGIPVYKSAMLQRIWDKGFVTVSDVCEKSLKYVCRYVLKKVDWDPPRDDMVPMFTVASSRPAIGYDFFMQNWRNCLAKDENGDILRYGFPDLWRPGEYLDIRYYRKLLRKLGDGIPERHKFDDNFNIVQTIPAIPPNQDMHELDMDIDSYFALLSLERQPLTSDDLVRMQEFSRARLSHNTHYGRILNPKQMQEIAKNG